MRNFKSFLLDEDGMGTVEIVLIIVILIALVALFKKTITDVVKDVLAKVTSNANTVSTIPTP
jgi:Flp pilus assembly pilin Flp